MSSSNKRGLKQPLELITPPSSSTSRDKQQEQVISLQRKRQVDTLEYRNGSYHGQLISNYERNGLGVFSWDSGEAYFGEWMQDTIHGEGVLFFPQGGFVHGFFRDAKLTGPAFFKFSNGDIYEGFWKDGKLNGNCYKYFVEENKWVLSMYIDGNFTRVISKGEGLPPSYVFKYITSTSDLAHRYKQPQGLNLEAVVFQDGGQFLGVIQNDAPNNLGIFRYSDGKYDVGTYSKGNLHGLGRLNLHNGDVYDGYLIDGLFQGKGVFYQQETSQWVFGVFLRNKCVQIIRKGDGQFPYEITRQFRSEHHYNSQKFVDAETPFYPYQPPIYKQNPIDSEKYNFYLDLSIASSSNADPSNTSSTRKHNYFSYSKSLKASSGFSQVSSSPPKSSMQSSPSNGRSFVGNYILKDNSSSMSKTAQFSKSQGFIAFNKKSSPKGQNNSAKQQQQPKSILVDSSNDKKKTKEIDTNNLQENYELKFSDQPNTITRFSESIPRTHFEEQSFNMKQFSEQDSKSDHPQELKVQVVPARKISVKKTNQSPKQPWSQNFIKPNIFSKQEEKKKQPIVPKMIKQSSINKHMKTEIRIKGEDQQGSSFSSFQSQQILRTDNFFGKKQSSARYIPINMIQEEDKLRSLSGTPLNRFNVNDRVKNHLKNYTDSGQNHQIGLEFDQEDINDGKNEFREGSREQKERNKSFLEAEKRVKRESEAKNINNTNIIKVNEGKRGDTERENQSSEDGSILSQQLCNKSSGGQLELANLRNELASYEQMVQQEIPSRTRKSRGRRDISRDQSLSQQSRTPLSTTPTLTPTHQEQQYEQKDKEEVEQELDLEDSNVVLDSIKQIKQQMLSQLNFLETQQKEIVQPEKQQFTISPSLNVPEEEKNGMRNDLLDQDLSPQNAFEDYENPYECGTDRCNEDQLIENKNSEEFKENDKDNNNQGYYNEEEVKMIAQKIERNLTFEQMNKKNGFDRSDNNNRSVSENNRRDQTGQIDIVIDDTAASNNDKEVEGQGNKLMKIGSQNIDGQKRIINTKESLQDQLSKDVIINSNYEEQKRIKITQESQVVQDNQDIVEQSSQDMSILSGTKKDKQANTELNQDKQKGELKEIIVNESRNIENQDKKYLNNGVEGNEGQNVNTSGSQKQGNNERQEGLGCEQRQDVLNSSSIKERKQQYEDQNKQKGTLKIQKNNNVQTKQDNPNDAQISSENNNNNQQSDEMLQLTVDQEVEHQKVEERTMQNRIEIDKQIGQLNEDNLQIQIDQERKYEEEQKLILQKQEIQRQNEEKEQQLKRTNELKQQELKQKQEEQQRSENEEQLQEQIRRQQALKQQEEEQQRQKRLIEEEEMRINELRQEQQRLQMIIDQEKQEEINQTQRNEQQKRLNEQQEQALREQQQRQEELSRKEKEVLARIQQEDQVLLLKQKDCQIEEDRLRDISLKILDEQRRYESMQEKQLADRKTQDTQTQDGLVNDKQEQEKQKEMANDVKDGGDLGKEKGDQKKEENNILTNKDISQLLEGSQNEQIQGSLNDQSKDKDQGSKQTVLKEQYQDYLKNSTNNQEIVLKNNQILKDFITTPSQEEEQKYDEKKTQTVKNQQLSTGIIPGTTYSSSLPSLIPSDLNSENQNYNQNINNNQFTRSQHQSLLTNPIPQINTPPLSSTAFLENKQNQLGAQKNSQQSLQSQQFNNMSTAKNDKGSQETNLNQGQDVSDTFITEQLAELDSSKKQLGQQFDTASAISSIRKTSFPNLLSNSTATSAWNTTGNTKIQTGIGFNASENQNQIEKKDSQNNFNTPRKISQNSNKSENKNDANQKEADKKLNIPKNELATKRQSEKEDQQLFVSFGDPPTSLNNHNNVQNPSKNLNEIPQNSQKGSQNITKNQQNNPISSKIVPGENPTFSSNNSKSQIPSIKSETQQNQISSNLFDKHQQSQQGKEQSQKNQLILQDKKLQSPLKQDLQIVHHFKGFQTQNRSRGGSPYHQNIPPSKVSANFSANNPTALLGNNSPADRIHHKIVKSNLMTIVLQSPYQTEEDNNSRIQNSIPTSPLKPAPFYYPIDNAQFQNRNRFIQENYQSNPSILQPISRIISNIPNYSSQVSSQSYNLMPQSPSGRFVLREETRVSYTKKVTIKESPRVIREVHLPVIQSQNSLQMSNLSNSSNSFIHFPQLNNSFNVTNCTHENPKSLNNSFSHQTTYGIVPQQATIQVNLPVITRPRCNSTQARIQHPQFLATPDSHVNRMLSSSPRENSRILTLSPAIPHSQPVNVIQQFAPIYQTISHSPVSSRQQVTLPIYVNNPQSASPGPIRRQIIISNATQGVVQNNVQQSRNEYYQRNNIQPNNGSPSSPSSLGNPLHSKTTVLANNIYNSSNTNPMIDHRKKKSNILIDQNPIDEGQEGLCSIF